MWEYIGLLSWGERNPVDDILTRLTTVLEEVGPARIRQGLNITFSSTIQCSDQVCRPGSDSAPERKVSEDLGDEWRQLEGRGGMWGGWSHHLPRNQIPSTQPSNGKICPWPTETRRLRGSFFYYLGKVDFGAATRATQDRSHIVVHCIGHWVLVTFCHSIAFINP